MNRRGFFSFAGAAAALATIARVKPAEAATVEYDLGGPHAWGSESRPSYYGVTNVDHTHEIWSTEMPTHQHSFVSLNNDGSISICGPVLRA